MSLMFPPSEDTLSTSSHHELFLTDSTEDYKKWNDDFVNRSAAGARFALPSFLILSVTLITIMLCM